MFRATEVTLLVREGPSSLTLYPVCKLAGNGCCHDDVIIMMLDSMHNYVSEEAAFCAIIFVTPPTIVRPHTGLSPLYGI